MAKSAKAPKTAKPTQVSALPTASHPTPIWKQRWLWLLGAIAALALLLTNINSILRNVRTLPGEWRQTSDQFFEWYGEYDAWKGQWTNNPEGFVDAAELNLSDEDFRINIYDSADGNIGGTIETKGICEKTPTFEQLLIDGSISSARRATIDVFDFIGGYRRDFAKLKLRRNGYVMTVIPIADPAGLFAKETRIAHYPDKLKLGADDDLGQRPICSGKRARFLTGLVRENQKKQNEAKSAK